jgi:hypothetical protein
MNESVENRVIQTFRERVGRGDVAQIRVTSRIAGGMPGEGRVEEEFSVLGTNQATLRARATGAAPEEASAQLDEAKVRRLYERLSEGLDSLVPREQARFVPDSDVGSITIEMDGEQATFFYLADEEQREAQGQTISPGMAEALKELSTLSRQVREKRED